MRWWLVIVSGWMLVDCSSVSPPSDATIPPRPVDGAPADRSHVETFAIDSISLGEVDRQGNGWVKFSSGGVGSCSGPAYGSSSPFWKDYGYDLDDKITTKDSTDVCALVSGAPKWNQVDGTNGIDNAWGATLMTMADTIANTETAPSTYETQQIQSGAWTLELQVRGLPAGPKPVVGVAAEVFTSGAYGAAAPSFDSTTDWPVLASSTVDGATIGGGALVSYDDAYVTSDGTFVSGTPSDSPLVLPLVVDGIPITLRVHHAVITFQRAADDVSRLTLGTIAGVLDTNEFVTMLRRIGGLVSPSLCGSASDGIAGQIIAAQDILAAGTNAPGVPCDAISIGLGFTARLVGAPTRVVPDPPLPADPCATSDGGTDTGLGDANADVGSSDAEADAD